MLAVACCLSLVAAVCRCWLPLLFVVFVCCCMCLLSSLFAVCCLGSLVCCC